MNVASNNIELGEDFKVSFGLSIAGTSATPSEVRVFLSCCESIRLCSIATLNSGSNEYETSIPILTSLFSGKTSAKLSIEVVLNGKVITPYSQTIDLNSPSVEVTSDTPPSDNAIRTDTSNFITQDELRQAAQRYVEQPKPPSSIFSFEDLIQLDKEEKVIEEKATPTPKKQIQFTKPVRQERKAPAPSIDLETLVNVAEAKLNETKPKVKQSVTIDKPIKIVKEQTSSLFKLSKTKIVER
jgi:hypothetical protein